MENNSNFLSEYNLSNDEIYRFAGHVLGIKEYKSSTMARAHKWFSHVLDNFIETLKTNEPLIDNAFNGWLENIKQINQEYQKTPNLKFPLLHYFALSSFKNDNLIYLPIEIPDHVFSMIIYQNYIAIVNRGDGGNENGGIEYYKLKPEITVMRLIELLSIIEHFNDIKEFESFIISITDRSFFFVDSSVSAQKYGTCGYANKKSAIRAIYALVEAYKNNTFPNKEICALHLDKYKNFSAKSRVFF